MLSKAGTVKSRITKAQAIELNWENASSNECLRVITAHADAIGAPKH